VQKRCGKRIETVSESFNRHDLTLTLFSAMKFPIAPQPLPDNISAVIHAWTIAGRRTSDSLCHVEIAAELV
jgi:hypothetical protein